MEHDGTGPFRKFQPTQRNRGTHDRKANKLADSRHPAHLPPINRSAWLREQRPMKCLYRAGKDESRGSCSDRATPNRRLHLHSADRSMVSRARVRVTRFLRATRRGGAQMEYSRSQTHLARCLDRLVGLVDLTGTMRTLRLCLGRALAGIGRQALPPLALELHCARRSLHWSRT